MAGTQKNGFQTIEQNYNDVTYSSKIFGNGDDAVLRKTFTGNNIVYNKAVCGRTQTNQTVLEQNELTTKEYVQEYVQEHGAETVLDGVKVNNTPLPIIDKNGILKVSSSDTITVTTNYSAGEYAELLFNTKFKSVTVKQNSNSGDLVGSISVNNNGTITTTELYSPLADFNVDYDETGYIKNRPFFTKYGNESGAYTYNFTDLESVTINRIRYYGNTLNISLFNVIAKGEKIRIHSNSNLFDDFNSVAVETPPLYNWRGYPYFGITVGNIGIIDKRYAVTDEPLALFIFNDGENDNVFIVSKYDLGNSQNISCYRKTPSSYVTLNDEYISENIQRVKPARQTSNYMETGKFNDMGEIVYSDIYVPENYETATIDGEFTSLSSGTMSNAGATVVWRGDVNIVAGETYQFYIKHGYGKIEKVS